jgi:endonuclease I
MKRGLISALIATGVFFGGAHRTAAQYDPPAGYYDTATGTGATLKNQLSTIMSTGHVQRTYGDFRFASALIDQDPANAGNLLEVYNRASVSGVWDCPNGNCVWNREHVWPQSRQPGSANNSSIGNLGDPLALRPADPGVNSDRGDKPFGNFSTTGAFGSQGTFYFPGDQDKGDIARNLFYSATRYQSSGLVLVSGVPTGNQMGDLQSLLRWHYTDPPDEFERRRNHVIFSSSLNPTYFTNNRNAYIDRPEFVWSVFGGGSNDSKLYVGGVAPGDGASALMVDLGDVLMGASVPPAQAVTLNKDGTNPTYYAVTPAGDATSSISGALNAFDFDPQATSIDVGLSSSTATAGLKSGTVTIDNLDADGAGVGMGSADGDDLITVNLAVLDHAEASFDPGVDQNALVIDFGTIVDGGGILTQAFTIENLENSPGFTAALDLDGIAGSGQTAVLFTDLAPFADLAAGSGLSFEASFDTSTVGVFSAQYILSVSDENLAGAAAGTDLVLTLMGEVSSVCDACDANCDGFQTIDDVSAFVDILVGTSAPCSGCAGDTSFNSVSNGGDVQVFVNCMLGL